MVKVDLHILIVPIKIKNKNDRTDMPLF